MNWTFVNNWFPSIRRVHTNDNVNEKGRYIVPSDIATARKLRRYWVVYRNGDYSWHFEDPESDIVFDSSAIKLNEDNFTPNVFAGIPVSYHPSFLTDIPQARSFYFNKVMEMLPKNKKKLRIRCVNPNHEDRHPSACVSISQVNNVPLYWCFVCQKTQIRNLWEKLFNRLVELENRKEA